MNDFHKEVKEWSFIEWIVVGSLFLFIVTWLGAAAIVGYVRVAVARPCAHVTGGLAIPTPSSTLQLIGYDAFNNDTICIWSGKQWEKLPGQK